MQEAEPRVMFRVHEPKLFHGEAHVAVDFGEEGEDLGDTSFLFFPTMEKAQFFFKEAEKLGWTNPAGFVSSEGYGSDQMIGLKAEESGGSW